MNRANNAWNYFQSHLHINMLIELWFWNPCVTFPTYTIDFLSISISCSQAQQMKNSQWKARLYHHSAITACSVLSSAMFRMEDRGIALGSLFVENGCFEKMWWADRRASVRWSPAYCHAAEHAHVQPSSLYKVTHKSLKLISVLMDCAQSDWRNAGDKGSGGAEVKLNVQ